MLRVISQMMVMINRLVIGDAIQLQLAAHAAFGKARGQARVSKATRRASSSAAS